MGALTHSVPGVVEIPRRGWRGGIEEAAGHEAATFEQRLIEAARRGDREALERIVREHQSAVYAYLRSRLLEPADAEDLCQEVFLRCYAGQVAFERTIQLRPWLLGIARNVLREHLRRLTQRKEVTWTELCLELEALVPPADDFLDDALSHLPHCLDSLGKSAREALDMRYQAQLRLAEIGRRLHRSEGAIKLLMHRARQALKHCLDARLHPASHG